MFQYLGKRTRRNGDCRAQRSYLETLASDIGESFNDELTKAEASKLIKELRQRSPRVGHE